jgi:two-component system cell cycle response regulator
MDDDKFEVLLVEDNPGDARLIKELLNEGGEHDLRLTHVTSLQEAIDRLSVDGVVTHAVLLDLGLPDETGLETLRRLLPSAGRSSVVVMTGVNDELLGVSALQEGAQDYLVKGQVDGRALRRALRYAIERNGIQAELRGLSMKDDLTGLLNRRGFLLAAQQQLQAARRNDGAVLLGFVDFDGLKEINDTLGHAAGDRALAEMADVLRCCFRQRDLLARLGGDEFALLATDAGLQLELVVRARLAAALEAANARPDRAYRIGCSIGCLTCRATETASIEDLLQRADALMYEEKKRRTEDPS